MVVRILHRERSQSSPLLPHLQLEYATAICALADQGQWRRKGMRCLWHLNNHDCEPAHLRQLALRKRSKDQWYGDRYTYAHVSVDFHSL